MREPRDSPCRVSLVFLYYVLFNINGSVLPFTQAIDDDPSAGSPTETLLRLLLPLNDQVRPAFPSTTNSVESKGLTKPFDR